MSRFAFDQIDVFTGTALLGNALAVVHGADPLDDERMQALARWTNLSETSFLLAPTDPGADYRVRIFTPGGELPFAGHPTLGSCHAWLGRGGAAKRAGEIVQQCGIGLVRIRRDRGVLAFAAPPLARREVDVDDIDGVLAALGIGRERFVAAQWLQNGPNWLTLLLDSAATVLDLAPDGARMRRFGKVGVVGPHARGSDCAFEVRGFVCDPALYEDPVTGSLNAGIAEWLIGSGRAPERYVASQGTRLARAGRVRIAREGDTVWVGGESVTCVRGDVEL
ncbi:MAG TPA: PhzF family phenazine biosynthesis protein [Caldimonas sp.]|jgi:PhzF family phenazine biosynthesis protein|nr:PhzF family phenazine biosynthesis protein [Caldimonas sp.]HEX4235582.1 PhzF family phenazine biosynthesis protein [Caldimonas sp.]